MKVTEIFEQTKSDITFSIEITPPMRGTSIDTIFDVIKDIKPFKPLWIDVTSHGADTQWIASGGPGTYKKRTQRKSPGTIAICGAIEYKFGIPTVPHMLCNGFTCEETEDSLIDLAYLGINNVLAVRGDDRPKAPPEDRTVNHYALDLVKQIQDMNDGKYLHQEAVGTDFCVGVACYPEKHFEAPNVDFDIERLEAKQNGGAKYAVTQMFFDNRHFYSFLKRIDDRIHIPIIPAFKILTGLNQLVSIPKNFYVDIPQELVKRVEAASSNAEIEKIGVEWTYEQCMDLIDKGHTHFHFYIMKKTGPLIDLLNRLIATKHPKIAKGKLDKLTA